MKKEKNFKFFRTILLLSVFITLQSCSSYMNQPILGGESDRARLGPETEVYHDLKDMPKPDQPIVVAVYKFRDQTGQYKPAELGQSWSTAITQGATTILIRALEESGWFVPIERENIGNLLNERKIIRSSRMQYSNGNGNDNLLPPLLFAGIILEGGIISYESNIRTGGVGVRYFGTGASTQYREDRVSIYLRAVSTSNGKILKTVYTTKSILSQKVDIGVFKYVDTDKILEAETGFTRNEPSEMAVTEAIQMAVESLIFEGVETELWKVAGDEDLLANNVYQNYNKHKEKNLKTNQYDAYEDVKYRGWLGLGVNGGFGFYEGDFNGSTLEPSLGIDLEFALSRHFSLLGTYSRNKLSAGNNFESIMENLGAKLKYSFIPLERISPYLTIGGALSQGNSTVADAPSVYFLVPKFDTGIGLEVMLSEKFSANIEGNYNYYFMDNIDGLERGSYNDLSWNLSIGLKYYIGNR